MTKKYEQTSAEVDKALHMKKTFQEIANRIANLHYSEIPETKEDLIFRRQKVLKLKKLIESELKNFSN